MKIKEENKKYFKWGFMSFCVICASFIFIFILTHFAGFSNGIGKIARSLLAINTGLILAYLLNGAVNSLENLFFNKMFKKKKFGKKSKQFFRGFFIVLTELLMLAILYIFTRLVFRQLYDSIVGIGKKLPEYGNNLKDTIGNLFKDYPDIQKNVYSYIDEATAGIGDYLKETLIPKMGDLIVTVGSGVFSAIKVICNLFLGLIVCFYALYNKETFAGQAKKLCYAVLKPNKATNFIRGVRFTHRTFGGFIIGKIIDSFVIGLICFIMVTVTQMPYPVLISVIIGFTNIIPVFGPYIGAIPTSIIVLMVNPKQCLFFVLMVLVLQQIDGNIIGPKILKNYVGINSFWIIFAITFMGGLFGIPGMIVGVPVFAVVYTGIRLAITSKLKKKDLATETTDYCKLDYIDDDGNYVKLKKDLPPALLAEDMKKLKTADEGSHIGENFETGSIDQDEINKALEETKIEKKKHRFKKDKQNP